MEQNFLIFMVILNLIFFLCNLAFTIGGSIVLNMNNEASNSSDEFFTVWLSNLILTIVSGIGCLAMCFNCCGFLNLKEKEEDRKSNNNSLFELINLGVSIWAMIIYFDNKVDLDLLESQHYSLFMLLKIRVFYSIAAFSLVGLILVGVCITGCAIICSDREIDRDSEETNDLQYRRSNLNDHIGSNIV